MMYSIERTSHEEINVSLVYGNNRGTTKEIPLLEIKGFDHILDYVFVNKASSNRTKEVPAGTLERIRSYKKVDGLTNDYLDLNQMYILIEKKISPRGVYYFVLSYVLFNKREEMFILDEDGNKLVEGKDPGDYAMEIPENYEELKAEAVLRMNRIRPLPHQTKGMTVEYYYHDGVTDVYLNMKEGTLPILSVTTMDDNIGVFDKFVNNGERIESYLHPTIERLCNRPVEDGVSIRIFEGKEMFIQIEKVRDITGEIYFAVYYNAKFGTDLMFILDEKGNKLIEESSEPYIAGLPKLWWRDYNSDLFYSVSRGRNHNSMMDSYIA